MLKRIVLFLLMLSPFMFSNAWADEMKEPFIVTINRNVRVYSHVATDIANKARLESDEIFVDSPLMKKVTKFYEIAQKQAKSYNESLVNKTIQVNGTDVSFGIQKRMVWVKDGEIRIKFDSEKNVIASFWRIEN